MGAGAANASEDEVPHPMLQHRAVADFQNVADVCFVSAVPGLGDAHVTDAAGGLDQSFGSNRGVCLPANPVIGKEAIEKAIVHHLSADQINRRLAEHANIFLGVEKSHAFLAQWVYVTKGHP